MNTIVREMNPAEEIELTDAQLVAVYGACDDQDDFQRECDDWFRQNGWNSGNGLLENRAQRKHVKVCQTIQEHFAFSFDVSIKKVKEEDESKSFVKSHY